MSNNPAKKALTDVTSFYELVTEGDLINLQRNEDNPSTTSDVTGPIGSNPEADETKASTAEAKETSVADGEAAVSLEAASDV